MRVKLPSKISTNKIYAGIHWATRKRIADEWHTALYPHKIELCEAKKGNRYPLYVQYNFYLKGKLLDVTNCSFMVKLLEDAMIAHGIIDGDSPEYIGEISITVQKGDNECDIRFA
jgi:hypothetical protein